MNGQQFSSSGVRFTYRPAAAVSSVSPTRGAAEGGTPVTVRGSGFSSAAEASGALLCRWNASSTAAAYVDESTLVCNTSRALAGYVSVEVSTNGREYTSDGVQYEFVYVALLALTPWSGPELGGTVLTIGGSHLSSAGALRCGFGVHGHGHSSSSTLMSSSAYGVDVLVSSAASAHGSDGVRCVSPASLPTGWTSVELSTHGTVLRSAGSFYVHAHMRVSALLPAAGPVAGGTLVSVLGASFGEGVHTLRCRFESSGATAAARRVGIGQLECAAPPSSGAGSRAVEVSMNGQQFLSLIHI